MDEIARLIKAEVDRQVEARTAKYQKALREAIDILQALATEPEMQCDTCGNNFTPTQKVVAVRRAFCSDDCKQKAEHKTHPRLSYAPENEAARSEAQQNRRAIESATPKHDCPACGKPTTKLYCSDDCRKEAEAPLKADPVPVAPPVTEDEERKRKQREYMRAYNARKRAEAKGVRESLGTASVTVRMCEECHANPVTGRGRSKYCSSTCRAKANDSVAHARSLGILSPERVVEPGPTPEEWEAKSRRSQAALVAKYGAKGPSQ